MIGMHYMLCTVPVFFDDVIQLLSLLLLVIFTSTFSLRNP